VTADSLPSRTAAQLGVEPKPAVDATMVADLLPAVQQHVGLRLDDHPLRLDLEAVERAFGRQILDDRVRSSVESARVRALTLSEAAGRLTDVILFAFVADLYVCLAVERPWRRPDAEQLLHELSRLFDAERDEVAIELLTASLRAPQLLELPPMVALEVQLSTLLALTPVAEASAWIRGEDGRPECLLTAGTTATTRRFRAIAQRTLDGRADSSERSLIVGVPIRRWQMPWGAVVVRVRTRDMLHAVLEEAASALSPIVERAFLLERSAEREQMLVKASERRLSRLGFDLHDGALQHVAALGADIRNLRARVEPAAASDLDGVAGRLVELDRVLRELAHSLEPASLLRRPLEHVIEVEAEALRERTGIFVRTHVTGDFGAMTHSQKIALIRVVQEAFTNIREHSNANSVDLVLTATRSCVELQIVDDGDGFEVTRTLQHAAQRGRLGLVGSSERVRLLGGTFDIRSRVGGPTTVGVMLPRWQPLAADESAFQLAY